MSEKIRLRPAHPKADIPDPEHGHAPLPYVEEGVERDYTPYWAGHIRRGDVVVVAPAEAAAAEPAPGEDAASAQS